MQYQCIDTVGNLFIPDTISPILMRAWIIIKYEPFKEHIVYNHLYKQKITTDIHSLFGEWDIIIQINNQMSDSELKQILDIDEIVKWKKFDTIKVL